MTVHIFDRDLQDKILDLNANFLAAAQTVGIGGEPAPHDFRQPRIVAVPATRQIVHLLQRKPEEIYSLTPGQFEELICDRLSEMGFDPQLVGGTYKPDGGVDIIACPRAPVAFPFLLAVQVKHHRISSIKTGPAAVKDLQAVMLHQPFNAGLIVTNTTFTPDAKWFAMQRPNLVRLRDITDVTRWIKGDFLCDEEWREIPEAIELRPGLVIAVPGVVRDA